MTALASRRRNRTLVALGAGLAVLAAMPVLGVAAWRAIRDSEAAQNVGTIQTLAIPSTPTALLAAIDETGQVASLTVLALRPTGGGGTVVSVAGGSKSESSPEVPRRVADAYTLGGAEQLVLETESLMGVTFSLSAVMTEDEIADLLGGLGTVPVTLASDLRDSVGGDAGSGATTTTSTSTTTTTTTVPLDPFATTTTTVVDPVDPGTETGSGDPAAVVVVPSGSSDLDPAELAAALTAREDGAPESDRYPSMRALWDGVAAGVGEGVGTPPLDDGADPATMDAYVDELFAGPIDVWQINATPITDSEANPEGLDLYSVRRGEIVLVMASVAPSAVSPTLAGPSAQVDSAFGDAELTLSAVELFAFFNTNVLLVREIEGPAPEITVIRVAEDPDTAQDYSFLEEIVGPVEIEYVDTRVEGIDFQVTLGESYRDFLSEIDFDPTATTLPADETPTTDAPPTTEGA